jgi:uncharacterized protein YecE (DUF72 family)
MTVLRAYIGTSGWNYAEWAHDFYADVAKKDWLRHYAQLFTAVEVNATFYRLQNRGTLERWKDKTPPDFRFAIKANRYLTHTKKLHDPEIPVQRERESAAGLGEKLAVVLWQLPAGLPKVMDRLAHLAKALDTWEEVRHALEFRHPSWFDQEVADHLSAHRLAVCLSDAADWPLWDTVTTNLVYVRLHGHTHTYASAYGAELIDYWASRTQGWLAEGRCVHVYFDNTAEANAPRDALRLRERLKTP